MGKENSYIHSLDGLRAISILIVFFSHQGYEHVIPGGLGVTIFFFISGFLITNLLFAEYTKSGTIDFGGFFVRRLLRLYPGLLFLLLLFCAFLLLTQQRIDSSEVLAALFYYHNYYVVYFRSAIAHFGILWSLAIEEHFYLFFPFLFIGLVRWPRMLLLATFMLVLLPLFFRIWIVSQHGVGEYSKDANYYLTHCRFDAILIGCLLSIALHSGGRERFLRVVSNYWMYAAGLLLLLFTVLYRDEFFRHTFRYSLQGLALLMLVPPIVYSSSYSLISRLLSHPVLEQIGRLSYSIYLFHWLSRAVFLHLGMEEASLLYVASNTVVTGILAYTSFYGVEMKFVALRKRFGSVVK